MLSPSDFIALFSAAGGSAYSASIKPEKLSNTFYLRFVVSLQASVVFLLAFAGTQYLQLPMVAAGQTPGVRWTEQFLTTSMPVAIYLIVLAVFAILLFHSLIFWADKQNCKFVSTLPFSIFIIVCQGMVTIHALTLEISPTLMDKF